MKIALRILAWAASFMWWPTQSTIWWPTRAAALVRMPAAMSWDVLNRARKAAERPTGMTYTYCKYPNCKRS